AEWKTTVYNKTAEEKYRVDFKKYQDDLSKYNWRKHEIHNNSIEVKKYRREVLEKVLRNTKEANTIKMVSQKGIAEASFEVVLRGYFGDKILINSALGDE